VLIDSPEIAEDLLKMLDFEGSAWRLRLDARGSGIEWVSGLGGQQRVLHVDPETTIWQRFTSRALSALLPENWL
jgi:hypothetical protein